MDTPEVPMIDPTTLTPAQFLELWSEWDGAPPSFTQVEDSGWEQDYKYQHRTSTYREDQQGRCFNVHESRSGSPFSDWDYSEPTCNEVFPHTVTRTFTEYYGAPLPEGDTRPFVKDLHGNRVHVGDSVVISMTGYRELLVAVVTKLTPKGLKAQYPDWRYASSGGRLIETQRSFGMFVKVAP